ncbi:uncharacterized protein LOC129297037 [Prosopis cineraria]|uniref:uncharacterized protein LOC129297037 n=1 Tax=Prosopis cineraria TaxID=364024 RepID=UPI00240F2EE1|nr:uncharacterized protein LOC129297037 [Prosopis cineraria]
MILLCTCKNFWIEKYFAYVNIYGIIQSVNSLATFMIVVFYLSLSGLLPREDVQQIQSQRVSAPLDARGSDDSSLSSYEPLTVSFAAHIRGWLNSYIVFIIEFLKEKAASWRVTT